MSIVLLWTRNILIRHEARAGDFQPGDVLGGQYTVVETLGRGSNGVTYKVNGLHPYSQGTGHAMPQHTYDNGSCILNRHLQTSTERHQLSY